MIIISIMKICYEKDRNNNKTLYNILIITICSFIIINTREKSKIHKLFAIILFCSLLRIMYLQMYKSKLLQVLFYLQLLISIYFAFLMKTKQSIFKTELSLIINFTIFYIIIHYK